MLDLFEAARRHDCHVILSSWEYQQSSAFADGREWYDTLTAVPATERHQVMATAMADLVQFLKDHGLSDRIAYAELHNEVDLSRLKDVDEPGGDAYWPQRPYVSDAVAAIAKRHPDVLATTCYGIPPHLDMDSVPDNGQVGHFHVYIMQVLAALEELAGAASRRPSSPR